MSRRQPIPGVDEAALAALAEQFPSGSLRPAASPSRDKAPLTQGNKEFNSLQLVASAASGAARRKTPGRGLAVSALLLALLAILIAATAVMPPTARSWLTQTLGESGIVNFVTGNRADIDNRLAAASQSIDALASKGEALAGKADALASREFEVEARLGAIETVVGSGTAMRRLQAVEAGLDAANQRLAAAGDAGRDAARMAAARAEALDARLAAFDSDLKMVQDKLAATERDVGDILTARLGTVEADIGALQKIDRRPEKFYLAVLQLRDLIRTANPFAREVAAAQALAGENADLAAALKILAAEANHGVATVAELRDNFISLVAPRLAAVSAANRQPIAAQAWGWVQSLFTAGASADRNAATIALAARSLDQGQLEAAVHQLLLLEDDAALVAAEWLKNASARLAADKAIASVMSQALEQLAASN